jgi:hypothetical protein
MMRNCDGTDPNLRDEDGGPCGCGLRFDDVSRSTVWPHEILAGGTGGLARVQAAVRAARGGGPPAQIRGFA